MSSFRECMDLVAGLLRDAERIIESPCISSEDTRLARDFIDKFNEMIVAYLESAFMIVDTVSLLENIFYGRRRTMAHLERGLGSIDNIIVDYERYLEATDHVRSLNGEKPKHGIEKLVLTVSDAEKSYVETRFGEEIIAGMAIRVENIGDTWRNMHLGGHSINIGLNRDVMLTMILARYIASNPLIAPLYDINVQSQHVSNIVYMDYGSSSLTNIEASPHTAFIELGYLTRHRIKLRMNTIDKKRFYGILEKIAEKKIYPRTMRGGNKLPILIKFFLIQNIKQGEPVNMFHEFIRKITPADAWKLSMAILYLRGVGDREIIIPENAGLNLYWECLPGQTMLIDDEEIECSPQAVITGDKRGSMEAVVIAVNTINDVYSLAKNRPTINISRQNTSQA